MGGPLSLYGFALECQAWVQGILTTPLPTTVVRARSRRDHRAVAPAGVVLRLVGGDDAARSVHDVSRRGLSFAAEESDLFARAGAIGEVAIEWQGRLRICGSAQIRHVSACADGSGRVAGAKLTFASRDDERHWANEVDALLDPVTCVGGTWTRDLWELFESSGYFALSHKSPPDFGRLREAFVTSSQRLERAPELGAQIVWPSARGVEASSSVIALNNHAVFLYHLARRSGPVPPGLLARELVYAVHARALRWIKDRRDLRWLVVWVQDVARFSKRAHLDFIERHADGESASIVTMRALEVAVHPATSEARAIPKAAAVAEGGPAGWIARDALRADFSAITLAARAQFPSSFIAAHGLDTFELSFRDWKHARLGRGREILVAEREGRIEAAAVLEWAEEGIHLFGLLDVLRIIPLTPGGAAAMAVLLAEAKRRFARRGKSTFVLACDPELPAAEWPSGSTDLGRTHVTVMSTELTAELAEHAWEVITGAPR
jgi:hypothetical protein